METLAELKQMDGTQGSEELALIDNVFYTRQDFSWACQRNEFNARTLKAGFRPTHIETWTYTMRPAKVQTPTGYAMYRTNVQRSAI